MAMVIPLIIVMVNYGVDIDHKWRGSYYLELQKNWNKDQLFIIPIPNFDERTFLTGHFKVMEPYEVMILGSSRMFLVDSPMLKGKQIFNAAASTSVIQDYVSTWQMVKNSNRIPKYLILGIDPWALNKNSGMNAWKTNSHLYQQFVTGEKLDRVLHYPKKKLSKLFSWNDFKRSVSWMVGRGIRVGVNPIQDFPRLFHGYRPDGSHVYSSEFMQQPSQVEVQEKSKEYVSKCSNMLLCDWDIDKDSYEQLIRMLQDAKNLGVKTLVILPPYQPTALKLMKQNLDYSKILNEYQDVIQNKLFTNPSVSFQVCNAIDPENFNCSDTDFVDGVHSRKECVKKMIQYCLNSTGFLTR